MTKKSKERLFAVLGVVFGCLWVCTLYGAVIVWPTVFSYIIIVLGVMLLVACFACCIIAEKISRKPDYETKEPKKVTKDEPEKIVQVVAQTPKERHCEYCGGLIKGSDHGCPYCGAHK